LRSSLQAIASIATILIQLASRLHPQAFNGITDLRTLLGGYPHARTARVYILYLSALRGVDHLALAHRPVRTQQSPSDKFALIAMRDQEDRAYAFPVMTCANIKDLRLSRWLACFPRIGRGASSPCRWVSCRPPLSVRFASIEMVIFCAVGGRLSLIERGFMRALLVNLAKGPLLSETFSGQLVDRVSWVRSLLGGAALSAGSGGHFMPIYVSSRRSTIAAPASRSPRNPYCAGRCSHDVFHIVARLRSDGVPLMVQGPWTAFKPVRRAD